ncbi:M23 family metallopeptidase [Ancylobacter sp. 6x-1]|uniref:M23 family metallopeptidase n=1 Tax=Ancylobacter crimeensis TaxID=2579147 RepID=A0ABT0D8E9_9HYPH|nr:M23 family metallopeptidase [Ancylobacter crimeensis]MCK0196221.1 M23 family metallopeptidase [Ancylobacter crimeensis]
MSIARACRLILAPVARALKRSAPALVSGSAAMALTLSAAPATGQTLRPDEVLSSITLTPLAPPRPVKGSDGKVHLAYELYIGNPGKVFVTLSRLDILDPENKVLLSLADDGLKQRTHLPAGTGVRLSPGGTAIVFLDVALPADGPVPARLAARVDALRELAGADGRPAPVPADSPLPARYTFTGGAVATGRPAVSLAPPLRGSRWVAVNGCCDAVTSHRGAVMAVNGVLRAPERFAIDFVQLDADNRLFTGDGGRLGSYGYFGVPVHAVADGTVVNVYDEAPEQTPLGTPAGITPANIGGNIVVVDIGAGNFAFFAHLQPGSLKVKIGDRVTTGKVIGLLGNSGNSSAPHLHFHVTDGTSPLNADSLPYVFTRFESRGVMADDEAVMEAGTPARIAPGERAGPKTDVLPMDNEVIDFPDE